MKKSDPLVRFLLAASLGLAIALNTIDGQSTLVAFSPYVYNAKPTININLARNTFFALTVLFILVDGAALLHILLHETKLTRTLTIVSLFLALFVALIPFLASFPDPYIMISLVLVGCQLPVPLLVEKEHFVDEDLRWKSGPGDIYLQKQRKIDKKATTTAAAPVAQPRQQPLRPARAVS